MFPLRLKVTSKYLWNQTYWENKKATRRTAQCSHSEVPWGQAPAWAQKLGRITLWSQWLIQIGSCNIILGTCIFTFIHNWEEFILQSIVGHCFHHFQIWRLSSKSYGQSKPLHVFESLTLISHKSGFRSWMIPWRTCISEDWSTAFKILGMSFRRKKQWWNTEKVILLPPPKKPPIHYENWSPIPTRQLFEISTTSQCYEGMEQLIHCQKWIGVRFFPHHSGTIGPTMESHEINFKSAFSQFCDKIIWQPCSWDFEKV